MKISREGFYSFRLKIFGTMNGLIIKKIETYHFRSPYNSEDPSARQPVNLSVRITGRAREILLEGWGEGTPWLPSFTGITSEQMACDIEKIIAPALWNREIGDMGHILEIIQGLRKSRYGISCSLSPIDTALFDLLGKLRKKPVYEMVREYLNIEISPEKPVEVRIPEQSEFVDCGERFNSAGEVLSMLESLESIPGYLVQPFHRDMTGPAAELKAQLAERGFETRIMADAGASTVERIQNIIAAGAADGAVVRMNLSGGFSFLVDLMKIIRNNPSFNVLLSGSGEKGPGISALMHGTAILYDGSTHPIKVCGGGFFPPGGLFGIVSPDFLEERPGRRINIINDDGRKSLPGSIWLNGDGKGLGQKINQDLLMELTERASVVFQRDGKTHVHRFPYHKGRPESRNVTVEVL